MIMFKKIFEKLRAYMSGPSMKDMFEEMVLQEAVKEQQAAVNDQITDAVTQAPTKPKRTRKAKSKNNK